VPRFPWSRRRLAVGRKIRLSDNAPLSDAEYDRCCRICDEIAAIVTAHGFSGVPGGLWWDEVATYVQGRMLATRDRRLLDHSLMSWTMFHDFPTTVYEDDALTAAPDFWSRQYARLAGALPPRWRVRVPARFGAVGWTVDGHPVNRHTMLLQERVGCLKLLGVLDRLDRLRHPVIVEIGGGGGEMGLFFARAFPRATYVDIDLPESLAQAAMHLAVWLPERRHIVYDGRRPLVPVPGTIVAVPCFLSDTLPEAGVDLVFNAWSLSEMAEPVAAAYLAGIARMIGGRGVFAQNNLNLASHGGIDIGPLVAAHFPAVRRAAERLGTPAITGGVDLHASNAGALPPWGGDRRSAVTRSFDHDGAAPGAPSDDPCYAAGVDLLWRMGLAR
jgi:hypothetical protein